ncbi:unnamed protein product, partial [marine sediment metagenome]
MADPWGPAKRQVTGLNEWVARFGAQDVDNMLIDAPWVGNKPIYVAENASIIIGVLDDDAGIQTLVNDAGEVTESNSAAGNAVMNDIEEAVQNSQVLFPTAAGGLTIGGNNFWTPFAPVMVTADGAGNPNAGV